MQRIRTVQAERSRLGQETKSLSAYELNQGLKQLQRHRKQLENKLSTAEEQVKHLTGTIATVEGSRRVLQVFAGQRIKGLV